MQSANNTAEPAWLAIARRYVGTRETPGAASNPVITSWAKSLGGWVREYYNSDSIPWCGLFQGFCFERAGLKTPGDALLGALNWEKWGQPLQRAVPGAVLVFRRPGGGHLGLYVGEDDEAYHVLGGNQADSVCVERIVKSRCVAIRWPSEVQPYGAPVRMSRDGKLSVDEA